jgi:hypothetical protein
MPSAAPPRRGRHGETDAESDEQHPDPAIDRQRVAGGERIRQVREPGLQLPQQHGAQDGDDAKQQCTAVAVGLVGAMDFHGAI